MWSCHTLQRMPELHAWLSCLLAIDDSGDMRKAAVWAGAHCVTRGYRTAVDRWFNNEDNGCFNINADNDPGNRKSPSGDLNSNIGSFPASSSLSGIPNMYSQLFQNVYELLRWLYPTVNTFPRKQRLILSQRLEVTAIRILELAIDLNLHDTVAARRKIAHECHKLQLLLRLCKDFSYLSFQKYEHASVLLGGIAGLVGENGGGLGEWPAFSRNSVPSGTLRWPAGRPARVRGPVRMYRNFPFTMSAICSRSNTNWNPVPTNLLPSGHS